LSGSRKATERRKADERPPAPWGSFPLAELTILAGIVMLAVGAFSRSPTSLAVGVVLAALGGLEVAVREHFAGYRSHTTLLAGALFVLVAGALFYLAGLVLAGLVTFVADFVALRRAFQKASGGLSFKAGRLRG
jgi:uncharacterized membrane protein HdeD (DUF308 family)